MFVWSLYGEQVGEARVVDGKKKNQVKNTHVFEYLEKIVIHHQIIGTEAAIQQAQIHLFIKNNKITHVVVVLLLHHVH